MAISWGAWEGGTNQQLRIGIDVSWEAITHGEAAATATIKVYLDVTGNWSDTQTITMTGSGSGSTTFSNNQNNNSVLRYTDSYTYTYPASSYGSSPGTRTFGASLSGAYNGATPSKSVTVAIPARPTGAPAKPTNVNTTRISDGSIKTTWTNNSTAGEPWNSMDVQVDGGANDVWNAYVGTPSGSATSFTDTDVGPNYAYRYRVRSQNGIAASDWVEGDLILTTPAAPTNVVRTGANGANQVITWTDNSSSYITALHSVERWSNAGGGVWTVVNNSVSGTTLTDTYPASHPTEIFAYRVRTRTNAGVQGTLYSAYSAITDTTSGVSTPPLAPTNLAPTNNTIINPSQPRAFTWQYNSSDTTAQTQFQFAWRVQGAGSFTFDPVVTSAVASWTAPALKFADNTTYEWQVATRATNATWGPYSAIATFKTVGDPNALREQKRVMRMNLETGQPETATVGVLPPIGSLVMFGGSAAPAGWLICDGREVLRSQYVELFGVIGAAFGAGNGSTTFNLPDMRSRLPMGVGAIGGVGSNEGLGVGGVEGTTRTSRHDGRHTHTGPLHSHAQQSVGGHTHGIPLGGNNTTTATGATVRVTTVGGSSYPFSADGVTTTAGSGHDHGSTPDGTQATGTGSTAAGAIAYHPYTALNFIIKA